MKRLFCGLFLMCVACGEDIGQGPMSSPYPILCQSDAQCAGGYCEDARCLRANPTMGFECNVFGIPLPAHGCQVTELSTYGTAHPAECMEDEDCQGSLFGQYCVVNLCSAQRSCKDKACDDPRFPSCHEHWRVCVK